MVWDDQFHVRKWKGWRIHLTYYYAVATLSKRCCLLARPTFLNTWCCPSFIVIINPYSYFIPLWWHTSSGSPLLDSTTWTFNVILNCWHRYGEEWSESFSVSHSFHYYSHHASMSALLRALLLLLVSQSRSETVLLSQAHILLIHKSWALKFVHFPFWREEFPSSIGSPSHLAC
jgi:hypothetical protein